MHPITKNSNITFIPLQVEHGVSDTLKDMHGSSEGDALEVIVSLSHKGEVEDVAQKAFAPRAVHITGAGGMWFINLSWQFNSICVT